MDELSEALAAMARDAVDLMVAVRRREARAFERLQRNFMPYGEALAQLMAVGWTRGGVKVAVRGGTIEKVYWRRKPWLRRRDVERLTAEGTKERLGRLGDEAKRLTARPCPLKGEQDEERQPNPPAPFPKGKGVQGGVASDLGLNDEEARGRLGDFGEGADGDRSHWADRTDIEGLCDEPGPVCLVGSRAAAGILGTSDVTVRNLVKRGVLRDVGGEIKARDEGGGLRDETAEGGQEGQTGQERLQGHVGRKVCLFDRAEVERLAVRRAAEAEERRVRWGSRVEQWGDRSTLEERMAVGCKMDFGWCLTHEAAEALGISVVSVRRMIREGRLPGQQTQPGKQGSPIRIPWWYVMCLRNRESYQERRARAVKGREEGRREKPVWEKHPIRRARRDRANQAVERDYREFYITRQVAQMAGVTIGTVRRWAARGKLKAHLKPREVWHVDGIPYESKGSRWLLFLKEDVHALLQDPKYRKRHAAFVYGQSMEAQARREMKEWEKTNRQLEVNEKVRRRLPPAP